MTTPTTYLLCSVLCLLCLLCISQSVNSPSSAEISALWDLYNSTKGWQWRWQEPTSVYGTIWNFTSSSSSTTTGVNPCVDRWQGITCNTDNTTIVELNLVDHNLNGTLPVSLTNLTSLTLLDLNQNYLKQPLPTFLCQLTHLTDLELSTNEFTGPMDACFLTSLLELKELLLDVNQLTGVLPSFDPTKPYATNLTIFSIMKNMLSQTIPSSYQYLTSLESIMLEYNLLTGDASPIFTIPNIVLIGIGYNALEGNLSMIQQPLPELTLLQIQANFLTGSIPSVLAQSNNMLIFTLFRNSFTGTLPAFISTYNHLVYFTINNNLFSGSLEHVVGNFPYLYDFMVFSNSFTGTLPAALSQLPLLEALFVQDNHFEGNLYSVFNATIQKTLRFVDISSNHFTGTIPEELFGTLLFSLTAYDLCLSPTIPDYVCNAKKMAVLSMDGITSYCSKSIWEGIPGSPKYSRSVGGGIPHCIWTEMPALSALYLSGNGITGSIPDLKSFKLITLDLSFNSMTGSIPYSLQTSQNLIQLNLKSNKFTGEISSMSDFYEHHRNFSSITYSLDLSVNRLAGPIPSTFADVDNIEIVNGNLFQCSSGAPIPTNDPDREGYVCGSDLLDISLWAFMATCLLLFSISVVLLFAMKDIIYGRRIKWCSIKNLKKLLKWLRKQRCCKKKPNEATGKTRSTISTITTSGGSAEVELKHVTNTTSSPEHDVVEQTENSQSAEGVHISDSEDEDDQEEPEVSFDRSYDPRRGGMRSSFLHDRISFSNRMSEVVQYLPIYTSIKETITFINDPDRLEQSVSVWMELTPSNSEGNLIFNDAYHQFVLYLLLALWWRSKVTSLQTENMMLSRKVQSELPHLILFLRSMKLIRRSSLALMLVIIFFTIPFYLALKESYATYTIQYRWNISAAFFTGYQPGIAIFFLWAISLTFIVLVIDRYIPMDVTTIETNTSTTNTTSSSSSSSKTNAADSTKSLHSNKSTKSFASSAILSDTDDTSERNPSTASADTDVSASTSASERSRKNKRKSVVSVALSAVVNNSKFSMNYFYKRLSGSSMWFSIFALLSNLSVVLTLKAVFVYLLVTISKSIIVKILLEVTLSVIDLVWDNFLVPLIITSLPKKKSTSRMLLKTAMLFFNGILAPCISLAVVDPSCFNNLFESPDPEYKSYHLFYCTSFLSSDACNRIGELAKPEKYVPVFHYNYNCYSTILNEYLPIFFISFIFLTFFNPFLALFLSSTSKRGVDWQQLNVFPKIYFIEDERKPHQSMWGIFGQHWKKKNVPNSTIQAHDETDDISDTSSITTATMNPKASATTWFKPKKVFYPDFLLATLMHQMLVMLTFGMLYPPLAIAIAIVICIKSFTWEILIGRWMVRDGFEAGFDINGGNFLVGNPLFSNAQSTGVGGSRTSSVEDHLRESAASYSSTSTTSTVAPLKIGEYSKQLEAVCKDVGCGPRRCVGLIAYGSGIFYALMIFDMVGDQLGWARSIWAPILVLAYVTGLIMLLKSNITKKYYHSLPTRSDSNSTSSMSDKTKALLTEIAVEELNQQPNFQQRPLPIPNSKPTFGGQYSEKDAVNPIHRSTTRIEIGNNQSTKSRNENEIKEQANKSSKLGIELRPISVKSNLS